MPPITAAEFTAPSRNWLEDFAVTPKGVRVKKSGVTVPVSRETVGEFLRWLVYFRRVRQAAPRRPDGPLVASAPDPIRPWYLLWPALKLAGARFTADPGEADVLVYFEDATTGQPVLPARRKPGARLINFGCRSVAKSAVAAAFEQAFGYSLAVDPARYAGPMVEKSEINGAHDGRIVAGPCPARPGHVYQRLIENRGAGGLMEDLRTPMVGGEPALVFIKRRTPQDRFTNHNREVTLAPVETVFSADEQAGLKRFCGLLALDWGGLDVLRDAQDGRIYIVDANKTDMGPPIALPMDDQIAATRMLAHKVRAYFEAKQPAG